MSDKKDGEPAFPCEKFAHFIKKEGSDESEPIFEEFSGMTIRDYFAGKAMQALIIACEPENYEPDADLEKMHNDCAESAYKRSDAMIKERDK